MVEVVRYMYKLLNFLFYPHQDPPLNLPWQHKTREDSGEHITLKVHNHFVQLMFISEQVSTL